MTDLPTDLPANESNRNEAIVKVAEGTLAQTAPPEAEPFRISFVNYREDKCTVNVMNGRNAQMAIKIVKDIGVDFKSHSYFLFRHGSNKLEVKPVWNAAPYDEYYKRLPQEIQDAQEVKEIKYLDTREEKEADLRIFFYTLTNIFYMLAITANVHENLDHKAYRPNKKQRRR